MKNFKRIKMAIPTTALVFAMNTTNSVAQTPKEFELFCKNENVNRFGVPSKVELNALSLEEEGTNVKFPLTVLIEIDGTSFYSRYITADVTENYMEGKLVSTRSPLSAESDVNVGLLKAFRQDNMIWTFKFIPWSKKLKRYMHDYEQVIDDCKIGDDGSNPF